MLKKILIRTCHSASKRRNNFHYTSKYGYTSFNNYNSFEINNIAFGFYLRDIVFLDIKSKTEYVFQIGKDFRKVEKFLKDREIPLDEFKYNCERLILYNA